VTGGKTGGIAGIKRFSYPYLSLYNLLLKGAGFFINCQSIRFIPDIQKKTMQEQRDTVADYYDSYQETQLEIFQIECRKTKKKLFTIAAVIFFFDFISLAMINYITINAFLLIAIVPVIFILLGLLSNKEPLAAMVLGIFVMLILYGLLIYRFGAAVFASAIFLLRTGLFVYLLIAGFQSAREAQRLKKELKL
jgi:hypothetical protein